jgi:hypothetical protein
MEQTRPRDVGSRLPIGDLEQGAGPFAQVRAWAVCPHLLKLLTLLGVQDELTSCHRGGSFPSYGGRLH